MNIRQRTEQIESTILGEFASLSSSSRGRDRYEEPCTIRTAYQCDRDRIVHSKSFRRLKHKTQVFISPGGDHYRTRLTHTLEVAQIARTISRALRLNEDLTEAISLGHDLGHTPFGHAGEDALNDIFYKGFHHYEQSVRIVEKLEKSGEGLNLTKEVRNGILCHTKGTEAYTAEGRVVRISDRIAYINHDIDDAVRAGVITLSDIPSDFIKIIGSTRSERVNTMVLSTIENSVGKEIKMSDEVQYVFDKVHKFMYDEVYLNDIAKIEEKKVPYVIGGLYEYFTHNPEKLPNDIQYICERDGKERAVCDYIAGMTDKYAVSVFQDIFIPKSWTVN